mmetsp:Transcript_51508/g.112138  ORF Transcript_51508/g.112138 Transcript_51508/m.112138 type:complete len:297 (+) Transcript_51508:302-1192(+)
MLLLRASIHTLYQDRTALIPILRIFALELEGPLLYITHEMFHSFQHWPRKVPYLVSCTRNCTTHERCMGRRVTVFADQQLNDLFELCEQSRHLGVLFQATVGILWEAVWQQTPQESCPWLQRLFQATQNHHPRKDEEELHIAISAHGCERRRQVLSNSELSNDVVVGFKERSLPNIASANFPALLPVDEPGNKANVVTQVRINALQTLLDFTQVPAHRFKRANHINCHGHSGTSGHSILDSCRCEALALTGSYDVFTAQAKLAQHLRRTLQYVKAQVVTSLTTEVGHRVEMGNALH